MTIRIPNQDKSQSISLIEKVIDRFCLVGISYNHKLALREHLAWMRRQPSDMNVNFKLETVPELAMTRIVLEIGFGPIPPIKN